ncbi:glycerophosphodiester phosphodiesterase [Geodermatophilus sp. YIM 151500]|uniref:glycerophosphodiester phosphodiesterase n=1 Tax=Geodermatophilus sp. YIM 151500 TaxID=2984531 RepID=UPI0021E47635|nr:glycerophosphodiester phosphodiesterase [Geodermatophilus sp. YIM 151500]MCV2490789.1 glycerophosphodiester phosphodiesterase [Geodermatophilus sp. YIM 151500]
MHRSRRGPVLLAVAVLAVPALVGSAAATPAVEERATGGAEAGELLVIGHRGASGYRPEHTLAAYELAARMGADYIEPDVVSTKDGVLVARHENEISGTTDVAERPEFADRRTTKTVDGVELTGWFTEDFTLEELRTLRAVERLPDLREENTLYDGIYAVPTLDEVLELRARLSEELGREIGVYPETKHPTYFDELGLSLEEPLVAALEEAGLDDADDPVFVQSFETTNLRELAEDGLAVPLVQLLSAEGAPYDLVAAGDGTTYADLVTPEGLAGIAEYASGIGPAKDQVIPVGDDGALGEPTTLVDDAHAAGLLVHPYTMRNENSFLPPALQEGAGQSDGQGAGQVEDDEYGRAIDEQLAFWEAGVDGFFTDNPDTGLVSRELFTD